MCSYSLRYLKLYFRVLLVVIYVFSPVGSWLFFDSICPGGVKPRRILMYVRVDPDVPSVAGSWLRIVQGHNCPAPSALALEASLLFSLPGNTGAIGKEGF